MRISGMHDLQSWAFHYKNRIDSYSSNIMSCLQPQLTPYNHLRFGYKIRLSTCSLKPQILHFWILVAFLKIGWSKYSNLAAKYYYTCRPNPAHIVTVIICLWKRKFGDYWHSFKIPIDGRWERFSDLKYFVNPKVRCLIRAYIFGDSQERGLNPGSFFPEGTKTMTVATNCNHSGLSWGYLQWHGWLLFLAGVGGRGGHVGTSVLVFAEDEWDPDMYKGCGMVGRDASTD